MKEKRNPINKPVAGTITIPVVEYQMLLKDHTLLEAILNAEPYSQHSVVEAARKALGYPEVGDMV